MYKPIKDLLSTGAYALTVIATLLSLPPLALGKVRLSPLFTNNMVLQQKENVAVWGWAAAGKDVKVTTSWNNKSYTARADDTGKWKAEISTPAYGGPYEVSFDDGEVTTLKNVLIGEVWLCSGQSNMEMPLEGWGKIQNYQKEIAAANYPEIHLLQVQKNTSLGPLDDFKAEGGGWLECSPATVANFSSVGYFFARNLFESKHIPVGIIHSSWGGTIAEAWTSAGTLKTLPDFSAIVQQMTGGQDYEKNMEAKYREAMMEWSRKVDAKDAGYNLWNSATYDDSEWKTMELPGLWEQSELPNFDGLVWFRKKITIPASWSGKELVLSLGAVDDIDVTYFNGAEVGRSEGWDKKRVYNIPAGLVKAGENTIAVRVMDGASGGGIYGEPENFFIQGPNNEKVYLSGHWPYKVSLKLNDVPPLPSMDISGPNRPTVLYNAMIAPLVPYRIKGALWYQGESNAARAYQYRELFPAMISDWRKNWGIGNFPFYYVQLANYRKREANPTESDWAELREAQKMALSLPNTGMAVSIDIGDAADIHPKNKQEVGRRLALIALANNYGEKVSCSGPLLKWSKTEGNKIILSFSHADKGLTTKDGSQLKGFSIAGADRKFHWAKAIIRGNEVEVSVPEVTAPLAVRYNWADNPDGNLYNGAGLPASPFRTDDWQGVTYGNK